MDQTRLNIDECIYKLKENVKESKLTQAEREDLIRCISAVKQVVGDWKKLKKQQNESKPQDNG